MELNIRNKSSRILLEKTDNGIILSDVGEDGLVTSRIVYEMYFKEGLLNFETVSNFLYDIMEHMKIPMSEAETNVKAEIYLEPIDPTKPVYGDFLEEDEDDPEDKDT